MGAPNGCDGPCGAEEHHMLGCQHGADRGQGLRHQIVGFLIRVQQHSLDPDRGSPAGAAEMERAGARLERLDRMTLPLTNTLMAALP